MSRVFCNIEEAITKYTFFKNIINCCEFNKTIPWKEYKNCLILCVAETGIKLLTHPNKHSSWWRRLEDVFHLCLQKTSSKRLQDVLQRCLQNIFKTYSTRFWDVLRRQSSIEGFALATILRNCYIYYNLLHLYWMLTQAYLETGRASTKRLFLRKLSTSLSC